MVKSTIIYTQKITVSNGKVVAIFTQGLRNGRKVRYIHYFVAKTGALIQYKKVSKADGNNAFSTLLAKGYKVIKREVA